MVVYEGKEEESLSPVSLYFLLCPLPPPPPSDVDVKRRHDDDDNNDPPEIYMIQIYFIFQPVLLLSSSHPFFLHPFLFLESLGRAGGLGMRGTDGEGVRFCLSVGRRREDIPIFILDRWRGEGAVFMSPQVFH